MNAPALSIVASAMVSVLVVAAERGSPPPLELRYRPEFILEAVARGLNVSLRQEIPLPAIHLASRTPLAQYQDAVQAQWGFRPHAFVSAYAVARNEIFLDDLPRPTQRRGWTLDESLAHEFVHYIQARYWLQDLAADDCEAQAVLVQRWFAEAYATRVTHVVAR